MMNLVGSFEVECFRLLQIIFNRPLMTKCISFYIVIRQMRQKVSFVSPLKTSAFNSHQSSVSKRISRGIQIFNSQVSIPFMPIISVHKTIDLFESRVSVSVLKRREKPWIAFWVKCVRPPRTLGALERETGNLSCDHYWGGNCKVSSPTHFFRSWKDETLKNFRKLIEYLNRNTSIKELRENKLDDFLWL